MNILTLGSGGMLGSMIARYFSANTGFNLSVFDERYSRESAQGYISELLEIIGSQGIDVIVNAVGQIPQKTSSREDFFVVNTLLPTDLISNIPEEIFLVHPSTDCIFNGNGDAPYSEEDLFDEWGDYGLSKALAERIILARKNSVVLRTSIIGTSPGYHGAGLLDWFLSHETGQALNGYTNHTWNGITTLEWCHFLEEFLQSDRQKRLITLCCDSSVSKYTLLCAANKIWNRQLDVIPFEDKYPQDKTLNATVSRPDIYKQLVELADFENS